MISVLARPQSSSEGGLIWWIKHPCSLIPSLSASWSFYCLCWFLCIHLIIRVDIWCEHRRYQPLCCSCILQTDRFQLLYFLHVNINWSLIQNIDINPNGSPVYESRQDSTSYQLTLRILSQRRRHSLRHLSKKKSCCAITWTRKEIFWYCITIPFMATQRFIKYHHKPHQCFSVIAIFHTSHASWAQLPVINNKLL